MSNYSHKYIRIFSFVISFVNLLIRLAPVTRANVKRDNRILGGIIAGLILSIISLTGLAVFIAYRK